MTLQARDGMRPAMRVIFMGAPEFATPALKAIVEQGYDVVAVYTRAPKPAGRRGLEVAKTPVHRLAEALSLPVVTTATLRTLEAQDEFRAFAADVAVVAAYGLILPPPVLAAPKLGCLNLHASLLPRWRGAAPIHRAVMAGDSETGVMVMKMEEGLDTGPIAMAERVPIGPDATTGDLHDALARLGADLMLRALAALEKGALQLTPQSATGATYANKIGKNETRVDWTKPWQEVHDHCRGLSPSPGAWFELAGTGRVKVLRTTKGAGEGPPGRVLDDKLTIACGTGALRLLELQRAGGKPMSADEFLHGTPVVPASVLG